MHVSMHVRCTVRCLRKSKQTFINGVSMHYNSGLASDMHTYLLRLGAPSNNSAS